MAQYTVGKSGEKFEIHVEGSKKKFELPAWDNVPARLALEAYKATKGGDGESAGIVLMEYIDDTCPGLLDTVSQAQLLEIVKAWQGDGANLGE